MARTGRLKKEDRERLMEHAKLIFINENITAKDLALRIGVEEKTMGSWIKSEGWEKLKRNIALTKDEQLSLMYDELAELNESIKQKPEGKRFADSKEANIRRYLIRDIKDFETDAQMPEIISSMTQFLNFVRRTGDLDNTKLVADLADGFIKSKLRGS